MSRAQRVPAEHPEPFHYYRERGYFIDSSEMYLRVLFEIEEEGVGTPTRPLLSTRLGLSRASVSEQLERLVRDGDVVAESDRKFTLTDAGRARASAVVRRHRLSELLLVEVIGLPWELAHVEASRWQHVLTPRAEEKLVKRLGGPSASPFGCPIPGEAPPRAPDHDDHGDHGDHGDQVLRLIDAAGDDESTVRLRYVPEHLQTDSELLRRLRLIGATPGTVAGVVLADRETDAVRLETARGSVVVDVNVAHGLLVEGTPRRSPPAPRWHRPAHRLAPFRGAAGEH